VVVVDTIMCCLYQNPIIPNGYRALFDKEAMYERVQYFEFYLLCLYMQQSP